MRLAVCVGRRKNGSREECCYMSGVPDGSLYIAQKPAAVLLFSSQPHFEGDREFPVSVAHLDIKARCSPSVAG